MATNKGKQFEEKFKNDWKKCFPDTVLIRLYDQVGGFSNINNPCDFISFVDGKLFLLECKSHNGTSISFDVMPQYERLLAFKNYKNVFPGFIIWFKEKDKVIWVDINDAEKIKASGSKSIQLKMIGNNNYNIIEIPSVKKRVFMDSDYSIILNNYKESK